MRPLRFVAGVIGVWVVGRMALLAPDLLTSPAEADIPRGIAGASPAPVAASFLPARVAATPARSAVPAASIAQAPRSPSPAALSPAAALLSPTGLISLPLPADPGGRPADATARAVAGSPAASAGAMGVPAPPPSRWSGGVYLYRRGAGGDPALATGGQLGGSQAGVRIARALGPAGPARIAAAVRLATPLDDARGAEAAAGIDLHPLPGRPLRVSIERRVDLGGRGRDAWSAYAAGGFWQPIGRALVADGYVQAGVVGARSRDLFADGALRLGRRRELGGGRALTLGAGAWGAAQPRVERLDVGPRAALSLPIGPTAVTLAAEWRVRVAGAARPGSGLALTLASDF